MPSVAYDAIVVGAGQGGGPLAGAFAGAGKRTALIEREHVGGTCINVGCTPTKTMIASARVAWLARRAAEYGVETGRVVVDMRAVRERKDGIVASFRAGSEQRIEETEGLDLVRGEARFIDARTLAVETPDGRVVVTAPVIVLDVGTRPAPPRLPGLDAVVAHDSTSIMTIDEVPEHLLILGGGYIGLEFGQMFRRFGSRVTIVQRGPRLLGREDTDVAEAVAEILREDGIGILLRSEAVSVARGPHDGVKLTVSGEQGEETLAGSHLLVAIGRTPNTDSLGLDEAGVATDDKGYIRVDERLETNVPGVFALGDVTGGPAFTHVSYDDFRILRTNLIDGGEASTRGRLVPYTVFIDPQLGRIGIGEDAARESGRDVRVAKLPMSSVARAIEVDEPRGFLKAVVDAESERILGFAALGLEGGEIMAMAQIAMMGDVPYTALRDGMFAHPTLAEAFNNLFATLDD
jgi:pyruvate/2-oxoglutarate dehydrogenase complex dihydrolipoamide dehydrogenase (E3) component